MTAVLILWLALAVPATVLAAAVCGSRTRWEHQQ